MSDVSKSCECLKIAAAVILPNVGGYWSSKITRANLKPWYESLKRPHWNPPNYVFAPVWISIYSSIGYASYLVYRDVTTSAIGWDGNAKTALTLYGTQLALNWAWTPLFFKYHSLKWVSDNAENQVHLYIVSSIQFYLSIFLFSHICLCFCFVI